MGPVATEIRVRRGTKCLEIAFADGSRFSLPAEYLRVESPSAEVQGHAPHERKLVWGKQDVNIATVEPIGHYAIRIGFTDGHDTGIYSWSLLHQLGLEYGQRWTAYLQALEEKNLRRDA
ncbi:MAG: DUF971 domain-containing protein [Acetobacteraceae bacterium]|nr:DUF971 domain-containing protein [Acetobacteraceae bacterium]